MVTLLSSDSPSVPDNLGHYPSREHDDFQGLSLHTPRLHCLFHGSHAACSSLGHDGEGHALSYHVALRHRDYGFG